MLPQNVLICVSTPSIAAKRCQVKQTTGCEDVTSVSWPLSEKLWGLMPGHASFAADEHES